MARREEATERIKIILAEATEYEDAVCYVTSDDADALEMAIKALEHEQRWIPVSERLPKNDEDVLVCSSQGAMEVCYYHIDGTFYPTEYEDLNETGWYNEDDDLLGFEPIAWMPLPEPYKAEREDNE